MYAAIRRWKADASRTDEATERLRKSFMPELKKIEGFVAYYFVQGQDEEVVTVSVFEDRDGVSSSTRLARSFAQRELKDIVQGPPEVFEGDVVVHETAEGRTSTATAGAR
jgi:heme-degrading monooxygenase HmoA